MERVLPHPLLSLRLRTLRLLPIAGTVVLLGACAAQSDQSLADISNRSPLELVGLTVESADGTRMLGGIKDLVLGPDNRVEQAIVATGAPAYPAERTVAVDSRAFRSVPARNALKLTGLSPDRFAELPSVASGPTTLSLGDSQPTRRGAGPADRSDVTAPR